MYAPSDVTGSAHAPCYGTWISGASSPYCAYRHLTLPWQSQFPTTPTGYQREIPSSSYPFCAYCDGVSTSGGSNCGYIVGDRSPFSEATTIEQPTTNYAGMRGIFQRDDLATLRTTSGAYRKSDATAYGESRHGATLSLTFGVVGVTRPQLSTCRYSSAQAQSCGSTTSGWENRWSDEESCGSSTTMTQPAFSFGPSRLPQFHGGCGLFKPSPRATLFGSRLPVHDMSVCDDVTSSSNNSYDCALGNITNFEVRK